MKRYTVKELQELIKAKDRHIEWLEEWLKKFRNIVAPLDRTVQAQTRKINNQKKRIKVLGKALVASQRDYEELKRSRRKK